MTIVAIMRTSMLARSSSTNGSSDRFDEPAISPAGGRRDRRIRSSTALVLLSPTERQSRLLRTTLSAKSRSTSRERT